MKIIIEVLEGGDVETTISGRVEKHKGQEIFEGVLQGFGTAIGTLTAKMVDVKAIMGREKLEEKEVLKQLMVEACGMMLPSMTESYYDDKKTVILPTNK